MTTSRLVSLTNTSIVTKYSADNRFNFDKLLNLLPPLNFVNGPWLAGGSCLSLYQNVPVMDRDFDVFFSDGDSWYRAAAPLTGLYPYKTSKKAMTYEHEGYKIQLVSRQYHKTLLDVFNTFDMTVCQFGFDGNNFYATEQGLADANDRVLRVPTDDYLPSYERIIKYMRKGYSPVGRLIKDWSGLVDYRIFVEKMPEGYFVDELDDEYVQALIKDSEDLSRAS
jgi:hypothetical protein